MNAIEEHKEPPAISDEQAATPADAPKKRKKTPSKKLSAEALQRRKEGRLKAAATLAQNLKKFGISRMDDQNGFKLTNIKPVPLLNQKNYFTDYLKKDEQVGFIRNWRTEKMLQQKIKKLKSNAGAKKEDEIKNFDDFNLNDIEEEMRRQKTELEVEDDDDDDDNENENENDNEEVISEKVRKGSDIIVIHPGSSNIRMGRAIDAFPLTVPTVVAIPCEPRPPYPLKPDRKVPEDSETEVAEDLFDDRFNEIKASMTKDFKARMRYYKRRVLPNSRETASNYNKRQMPERIPDHNDPNKTDWISLEDYNPVPKAFVGDDALKLPICEKFNQWRLRSPIVNGRFNESTEDYSSVQEILGDLANIVLHGLEKLEVGPASEFRCLLIIQDLYDKMYVETWLELLFKLVGFSKIGIIQESVAATFGAGTSSACVVDVGSQTTTISCVDEGLVINDSRLKLNFGGDNITEVFVKFLLQQAFPYREINLNYNYDFQLAQTLKHSFITFQDADIAVQIYNCYKRKPFEMTEKYEFKVFDEVMLAPLGLFYPDIFEMKKTPERKFFGPSLDQYTFKSNNPYSKSQDNVVNNTQLTNLVDEDLVQRLSEERNQLKTTNPFAKAKSTDEDLNEVSVSFPLERAIIEAITNAGLATDFGKSKKFYDNLLIVGGGIAKIAGYDLLLSDRINIWRPKFLSSTALDDVLDYVSREQKKVNDKRKQLTKEITQGKEDVELTVDQLNDIEDQCKLTLDLDRLDAISDKGQLLPVNVLPPPREFDPEMLTWKGGSVYGRLKVMEEMWMSAEDWALLENRCLYYKTLFNY